jgi:FKBP-type peptidyl-prolyl cis-trans isomerase
MRITLWMTAIAAACLALASAHTSAQNDDADASSGEPEFVYVKLDTSKGDIVLELDNRFAPISTQNFVRYVRDDHYDGTVFHRVIEDFMIQGGGFTEDLAQKPTRDPIENEWQNSLSNTRGTIAMARTQALNSATSQFYINTVDNDGSVRVNLDANRYAVFGRVVDGMEVVDEIRVVEVNNATAANGMQMQNVPAEAIVIEEASVLEGEARREIMAEQAERHAEEAAERDRVERERREAERALEEKKRRDMEQAKQQIADQGHDISKGELLDSGIWVLTVEEGAGETPTMNSSVTVHYVGTLPDGTEFDSSRARGEPATFPMRGVVRGFSEPISNMRVGGRTFVVVPPALAYGEAGRPPVIPPNATLTFDIELIDATQTVPAR